MLQPPSAAHWFGTDDVGRDLFARVVHATRITLGLVAGALLISAVIGGDTLPVRKPDPAPLLAAIRRLGLTEAEAVMIGDNEHDAATAEAAGVPFVLVAYGYARVPLSQLRADATVERFEEIPDALARISPA